MQGMIGTTLKRESQLYIKEKLANRGSNYIFSNISEGEIVTKGKENNFSFIKGENMQT